MLTLKSTVRDAEQKQRAEREGRNESMAVLV